MVKDEQVRRLNRMMKEGKTLEVASAKAGMNEKTARKYRKEGKYPSEVKKEHKWRTRQDIFEEVWEEVKELLGVNSGLEAKTVFEELQRRYPGRFADGSLRTLQRRIKGWRAVEGPEKEIFFAQEHKPGEVGQSDFTHMNRMCVTLKREPFEHLIYHFVLPYSDWETGRICFSESFESLSEGFQGALFELGGVPVWHQTDRMSAAINKTTSVEEFTERYNALLKHYGIKGRKIRTGRGNENGDVEQRHYRFKKALDQALMLRGSRDFESREAYGEYLKKLFIQLNAGRQARFEEEVKVLGSLPPGPLDTFKKLQVKVGQGSTIRVNHNTYSVHSRLIREWVKVHLYAERLEIWYADNCVDKIPRLRGENKHHIQYRHIIEWLVRKPGAFEGYKYRKDLFPTHRFRMAYDALKEGNEGKGTKQYLEILHLAAQEGEEAVDSSLSHLLEQEMTITVESVKELVTSSQRLTPPTEVAVDGIDLRVYDKLLADEGEALR